jgi:hypothetical protein
MAGGLQGYMSSIVTWGKFEIRNSKLEANSNLQMRRKTLAQNHRLRVGAAVAHETVKELKNCCFEFGYSSLFRVSSFEFRISSAHEVMKPKGGVEEDGFQKLAMLGRT